MAHLRKICREPKFAESYGGKMPNLNDLISKIVPFIEKSPLFTQRVGGEVGGEVQSVMKLRQGLGETESKLLDGLIYNESIGSVGRGIIEI